MNKEKTPYDQGQRDYPQEEIHPLEPSASDTEKIKSLYLPGSKANNSRSEESIEDANGLDYSKPNTSLGL